MELNTVYCGNCVEIMQSFPKECIDLTVTSPPYDNLRIYKGYELDWEEIIKELYRVTKQGGTVVWVVGDATTKGSETGTSFKQALWAMDCGFSLETMIYEKAQACFGSNNYYLQSFEYMFLFIKGTKPETRNFIKDRKNIRHGLESMSVHGLTKSGEKASRIKKKMSEYGKRKNIWKFGVGGGSTGHPAVFPEQLANDHIISWSNENDIIFDPMCGGGTTLKMAKLNNRNYIGIDISEEYCELARKRILEV